MGLVELLMERITLTSALLGVVAAYVLYKVYMRIDNSIRLKRLPGVPSAPKIATKLPFGMLIPGSDTLKSGGPYLHVPIGLDFVRKAVTATMTHKNLEMWRGLFASVGGNRWTAETRTLGRRIVFTADPENIKAILATQFGDYGKGDPFHREYALKPLLKEYVAPTQANIILFFLGGRISWATASSPPTETFGTTAVNSSVPSSSRTV
jgi:hypothetical protein